MTTASFFKGREEFFVVGNTITKSAEFPYTVTKGGETVYPKEGNMPPLGETFEAIISKLTTQGYGLEKSSETLYRITKVGR